MTNNTISTELYMERGCDFRIVKTLHLLQRVSFKSDRLEKRKIYRLAPLSRLRYATTVLTAVSVLLLTCIVVSTGRSTSHHSQIHTV